MCTRWPCISNMSLCWVRENMETGKEMQDDCSWRILRITIEQKQSNQPTNKLWSWKLLPANLSVKTVSHETSLQYFLTWPEPSNIELPSVCPTLWNIQGRRISEHSHTDSAVAWWASLGWRYKGAISNPKRQTFSTRSDSFLARTMVKRNTQRADGNIPLPWLV